MSLKINEMKKLFVLLLSCSVLMVSTNAIAGTIDTAKTAKVAKKAKAKAKAATDKAADKAKATADKAKDDAKTKADKAKDNAKAKTDKAADKAKATADKAKDDAATKVASVKAKKPAVDVPNKSADKAIGKDASGRTIYLGPKGGQYVLSASGKKEYLAKAKKIAVN